MLGERWGLHVQKCHLRYKTSDISEMKQSTAEVTTACLQKLVYGLSIGDKSGDLAWTLAHFSGSNIFHKYNGISHTLSERDKI